jgi:protein ImuB
MTSGRDRQRMVIVSSNRAALALGLTPGMAVTHAKALVANLDVRDADAIGDASWLERLALFAVRRWTPTAMVDGSDGILMDLTGASHLHGGEAIMGRRIVRFLGRLGFDARIAFAGNIAAANALARFGRDRISICEGYGKTDMLAPLPIMALRLDSRQVDAARRLGIERIGDLFAMPRGPLVKRFGASMLQRRTRL